MLKLSGKGNPGSGFQPPSLFICAMRSAENLFRARINKLYVIREAEGDAPVLAFLKKGVDGQRVYRVVKDKQICVILADYVSLC